MRVESRLKAYGDQIDARLSELLPEVEAPPHELHEAMRYSCLAPGKRLRPALCMASAEAVGGDPAAPGVLDAACALEMVHCFSLIHDDLPAIDDDALRRGAPTCHMKFGEGLALLAGDALFALAFDVLANADAPGERVLRAVQSLSRASGSEGLVGGEVMDVLAEGRPADDRTVSFIHSRKTGALIAASCEIGALFGGGSKSETLALRAFGSEIGLAFQIIDDLLNEVSTAEALGKAAGSDRQLQKATYTSLHGVEDSRAAAKELLSRALVDLPPELRQGPLVDLAVFSVERLH